VRHANGNTNCHSNGYANTDSYTNGYANTDSHAYGHSNGYANTDSYAYGHSNSYANTDSYAYSHSYAHGAFNTYSNAYAGGQTYADAQAAAAASSAGRAIIGTVKAGTREQNLASSPACGDRCLWRQSLMPRRSSAKAGCPRSRPGRFFGSKFLFLPTEHPPPLGYCVAGE
jgi:hypothetical protein